MDVVRNVLLNWVLPAALILGVLAAVQWFNKPAVQVGGDGEVPDFRLTDTEGQSVSLSQFRGQRVLLNFWESWCGPCKVEIPSINRAAQKNPDLVVLGLASDSGNLSALRSAKENLGIEFRVLKSTAAVRKLYGVQKVPTTFLIDEDGKVAKAHVGVVTPVTLGAWLR